MTLHLIILIGACLSTLLITIFFETTQDFWMSKDSKGLYKEKWKFWGQGVICGYTVVITIFDIYITDWYGLLLLLILGFVFWISHDAALGVRYKKGIYYLGESKFDTNFKAICVGSGELAFWIRVFVLALTMCIYGALCCGFTIF